MKITISYVASYSHKREYAQACGEDKRTVQRTTPHMFQHMLINTNRYLANNSQSAHDSVGTGVTVRADDAGVSADKATAAKASMAAANG